MHTRSWFPCSLSILIAVVCSLFLVLLLSPVEVQGEATPEQVAAELPSGRIVYRGELEDAGPIAVTEGHRYVVQLQYSSGNPGCVNCAASVFVGNVSPVWPYHVVASCFAGYGPTGRCATSPFILSDATAYIEVDRGYFGPKSDEGEVILLDLDYVLPADQTNAPCDCPVGCANQTQHWVGGPINTRTGNYHYSREDLSLAALGGLLGFERSYNSLETNLYTTVLGYGWTDNWDMGLTFPGGPGGEAGVVIVEGCHGARFRFDDNGDGPGRGCGRR